jgi:hypothetical protein
VAPQRGHTGEVSTRGASDRKLKIRLHGLHRYSKIGTSSPHPGKGIVAQR